MSDKISIPESIRHAILAGRIATRSPATYDVYLSDCRGHDGAAHGGTFGYWSEVWIDDPARVMSYVLTQDTDIVIPGRVTRHRRKATARLIVDGNPSVIELSHCDTRNLTYTELTVLHGEPEQWLIKRGSRQYTADLLYPVKTLRLWLELTGYTHLIPAQRDGSVGDRQLVQGCMDKYTEEKC